MRSLAPTLEAFFIERLLTQRQASPRTVASYRDTFRILLNFVHERIGKAPSELDIAELDAPIIGAFLNWLEHDRHNGVRTRNARLAAIHSLFRYASFRHPEHADTIRRVLAIPSKRYERKTVDFLSQNEIDALLGAIDRTKWTGRRDYALFVLAIQAGLRISELTGLTVGDLELGSGAHVRCHGKGRKQRATPLTAQTVAVLRVWLRERGGSQADPVFPTIRGGPLSSDAVQWSLNKYVKLAAQNSPSLRRKEVSPHVLRHSCAMNLLHSGVDSSVIALWMGHESVQTTQIYIHADMALKEKVVSFTAPPNTKPGRYRPSDKLLAFLEAL
jgi:site-specific recombinase XerD